MSSFVNHREDSAVSVDEASSKDNVTYYKISVKVGPVRWNVLHRYSDFVELHEKLVADHGVAKELLPPKKVIRNKTPKFVEQRREALSEYLKNIFNYLRLTMPSEFAHFLDFHLYDIFFLLQVLAKNLFLEGDKLLQFEKSHKFTPLELHAISERLKIACPSMEKTDQMYDFSHVLDFCSQVRSLNIEGSYEKLGTSNIVPNNLQFDLIPFKSLIDLKILGVPMACIQSVGGLRDTLVSLSVFTASVVSLNEFLLVDILHKDPSSIADTVKWKKLSLINFASNNIENVDWAIRLVPRLQHLSLTSNKLKELCDISCLHELRVLNLSMNSFSACDNWHAKIGNIVKIDLSQNKVESLRGFSRLYSLESLDLSCNVITDVEEVQHICRLPCLEYLWLTANPVASSIDYRVKVIEQFNARMSEICLDNEKASEKELDTARVLQALRVVKEGRGGAQWGRGGYNVNPRPELEAPRRGRGRARGGFPRQQQPQAEAPAAAAVEAPPVGVPQPKHLSKTSSPLTNDPLYMESFMNEMGTEMRAAPVANEVHPGHYGFASLAAEDYKSVAARSHVYAKTVSPSMHSYYVGMHVYARMLDLHRQTGSTLTVAESDFVTQMEVGNYAVTKLAEQYMAGFGNTTIPGSSECDFMFNKPALQAAENIVGFFGHIADNPIDYATYVCPGVLAQRIVEDVARTVAPVADDPGPNWQLEIDIPEEEADQEVVAPQPNIRCIGWAPRERLRQEMMNGLAHAQITPDAFHSDNASIPINTRLMNYVHYQLSEVRGYVEGVLPRTKNGSVAQLVTGVLNDNDEVSIRAPFPVAGSIAFFASAFRYRIDVTVNPQMLAPYEQAPVIANLERNRLSENPLLNEHLYHTIYIDSHARLKRIVKHNFAVKV